MTLAIIVQARLGSSRLPAKVLENLGGKPVLLRCLERLSEIPNKDIIVCAIPDSDENDPIADAVTSWGYVVSRGSEHDLLARIAKAARAVDAEHVMRVKSDCPMIDPAICEDLIRYYYDSDAGYVSNDMPARLPEGLETEIFSAQDLYRAEREAYSAYDRAHVTSWIRHHADIKRLPVQGPGDAFAGLRWTLDHPEDLAFMRALYQAMGTSAPLASAAEYARVCLMRPDLQELNAKHIDRSRLAYAEHAHVEAAPKPNMQWAA